MKDYNKNKESSYLNYWDVNKLLYCWVMSRNLPVNRFKWVENISQFNRDFIEDHNKDRDEGHLLEVDVQHLEKLHKLHNDLPFLPEIMNLKTCIQFV